MKIIAALLGACLSACVAGPSTDPSEQLADDGALTLGAGAAALTALAPAVPVTTWSSRNPVVWPAGATRVQVVLRRGEDNVYGLQSVALAFIIADGATVTQALRVPITQADQFLADLNLVLTSRELPGSDFSHAIAGSFYVGPRPGPIGDELDPRFVARLLRSAGALEDAMIAAVQYTL